MATPIFFTPEQVAEQFQVTAKTVREWLRSGDLIGVKVGRGWRIRASDVSRYLDDQRLNVLLARARRTSPAENWIRGRCTNCGEMLPVPNYVRIWVCSAACKKEYDAKLGVILEPGTEKHILGEAQVVPPY